MVGTKGLFQSKTIWGGLIAMAGGGVGLFGYTMSAEDAASAVTLLQSVVAAAGGLLAIVGRVKASKRIG